MQARRSPEPRRTAQTAAFHGRQHAETLAKVAAGVLTLSLHGAGGLLLLHAAAPAPTVDAVPPVSIMIELSDMQQAVNTQRNEVSADLHSAMDAAEQTSVEPEQDEEPTPVVQDAPEPRKPQPKRRVKKHITPPKEHAEPTEADQPPSRYAAQAQSQSTQSDMNAAPESSSSTQPPSKAVVTWQSRLMAHLERRKQYPMAARMRRETGVVYVKFNIDDTGRVLSAAITRSSGHRELDAAVLAMVRRASPVPKPPADAPRQIIAPVSFSLF